MSKPRYDMACASVEQSPESCKRASLADFNVSLF